MNSSLLHIYSKDLLISDFATLHTFSFTVVWHTLELFIYLSEQWSIEGELTSVHFARGSVADRRFIFHLIDEIVLIGSVDAINSVS